MTIFSPTTIFKEQNEFINYVKRLDIDFIKTNKKISYGNIACTIDIEVSSFYDENGNKRACMYAFTFGMNGISTRGRTYEELIRLLNEISSIFDLTSDKRLIFYVHNLGYEFQFFRKWFNWIKIFAVNPREPITAVMDIGIELRCSYTLSGYSLAYVGKNLTKYKVEKKVGDLDYSLLRHHLTPLNNLEWDYILFDGLVVMCYIQEQIELHSNNITKLPLTKTGEVRNYVRNCCLYGGGGSHKKSIDVYKNYHRLMLGNSIISVNEYLQLKTAFMGGFTHANGLYTGKIVNDVTSFDFTSDYPAKMITEKFPTGRGELIEIKTSDEFKYNLGKYCCIFDITFINIESTVFYEHYISVSKCRNMVNYTADNGRVVDAERLTITITEQDFWVIKRFYTWEKIRIKNFRRYKKAYLPKPFIMAVLELYKKKTELKDVKGSEVEYQHSKELLNSCFGMTVTDICRPLIKYDEINHVWLETEELTLEDFEKQIKKYNIDKRRFLSYKWGIWITAYARKDLFTAIYECKEDYIYSDTDSVKIRNYARHQRYFDNFNADMTKKLQNAMIHHGLDMSLVSPKTIKGEIKTLGYWNFDGHYKRFSTLGAKRYMVQYDNDEYSLTVSGLNKKVAMPFLISEYIDPFKAFKDGMYIPKGYSGKNTHTYIDEETSGTITDYLGKTAQYHELSSVHMEEAEYNLSLSSEYIDYLLGIRTKSGL